MVAGAADKGLECLAGERPGARSRDTCGSAIMVPSKHLAQEQHQSCPELSRAVLAEYADELGARMQCAACERCPRPARAAATCQLDRGERAVHIPRTVTRAVKDVRA